MFYHDYFHKEVTFLVQRHYKTIISLLSSEELSWQQ